MKEGFLVQNTRLGWVVSGSTEVGTAKVAATYVATEEFERELRNFCDMPVGTEEGAEIDDEKCELLYHIATIVKRMGTMWCPRHGFKKISSWVIPFNTSSASSNGISLNQRILPGPKL